MRRNDWVKVIGGFAMGSVGLKVLTSKPAQKLYTHLTAGALLAKDYVMETAETVQGVCADIAEDANVIREQYNAEMDKEFDLGVDRDECDDVVDVVE